MHRTQVREPIDLVLVEKSGPPSRRFLTFNIGQPFVRARKQKFSTEECSQAERNYRKKVTLSKSTP